jgi:hypothetical protein
MLLPVLTMMTNTKSPRTVEGMPLMSSYALICGIYCM